MTLHARLGPIPDPALTKPWASGGEAAPAEQPTRTITATAESYEQARAELEAGVPDGWRMLHIIVER